MSDKIYNITCSKCNGLGKIQGFSMIAGGTCFQCKGFGYKKGTKSEFDYCKKIDAQQKEIDARIKQKEELENYLWDNAKYLKSNIEIVINIKNNEDIENNQESKYVYDRQKKKVVDYLNKYKEYKVNYGKTLVRVEDILTEHNIKCL